jgi:dipeptidase D
MFSEKTKEILDIFNQINEIPRCSKNEEKIANWLINWGKKHGFENKKDKSNNVLIKIPPTRDKQSAQSVAIQGHMDMVCEKEINSNHDFKKDKIESIIEGDWLLSKKTTLGADDGIALAIGLSLAIDNNIQRPPLELLFTSDEETGLNGAQNLSGDFINSNVLINIDSEDEGVFTIGCAGGEDTDIEVPINIEKSQKQHSFAISIHGLLSGHSGIDINKNRANSIKLIKDLLKILNDTHSIELVSLNGGSARNAIAKSSKAIINTDKNLNDIRNSTEEFYKHQKEKYPNETSMSFEVEKTDKMDSSMDEKSFNLIIDILDRLPHGVDSMLDNKTPHTSNNLAKVETKDNIFLIHTNQRSLSEDSLNQITQKIESIAESFNAKYKSYNRYPSWQPNPNSKLLQQSIAVYEKLFNKKPIVEIIHAGLECGIIGSKKDKMDMLSIGPTIKDPHTPNERLYITSIEKIWSFLVELLKNIE